MADRVPAGLTAAEGRTFAFTVGIAFGLFGAIAGWREHQRMAMALGSLGGLLLVLGVTVPSQLGPVQRAWMGLAHLISKVTTPIFMGVVYFVVITPIALIMGVVGHSGSARATATGRRALRTSSAAISRDSSKGIVGNGNEAARTARRVLGLPGGPQEVVAGSHQCDHGARGCPLGVRSRLRLSPVYLHHLLGWARSPRWWRAYRRGRTPASPQPAGGVPYRVCALFRNRLLARP